MDLLCRLLKEFEKEYNLELCLMVNHTLVYGKCDNKNVDIDFITHNKPSKLSFDKEIDDLSINYLISVINNVYESKNENLLLEKLFAGKLNDEETSNLKDILDNRMWCLTKIYFDDDVNLENIINNIFDCNYIFVNKDKEVYLLIEKENNENKLLLELKDTIESEMYLKVRMLYIDCLNNLESILKAFNKLNMLDKIFRNNTSYTIASDKDFKLELLIDNVYVDTLNDILDNITKANFDKLDAELLNTINIFLKNNLSITNTSKELYIHRNTLIYRLDKIKQITGLDIRIFSDAFWMVISKTIYSQIK